MSVSALRITSLPLPLFLFLPLLLLISALAAPNHAMAESVTTKATPNYTTPNQATSGALLFPAVEQGKYIVAPLEASDVKIEVTGLTARTRVTQSFYNPTDGWLEGIYVFPLPEDAGVDMLKMQIGDRFIEGQIKERQEAKRIYEAAKAEGKKASLLEQERPNIFINSVANIGPGELVVIQIEYQQGLNLEEGEVRLRFPMVVAPRFNPPALVQMVSLGDDGFATGHDPVPDRGRISPPVLDPRKASEGTIVNPVSLSVSLKPGFALKDVESPFHAITERKNRKGEYHIALKDAVPANRDFELVWTAKPGKAPGAALFKERWNGEDYIYALLTPPVSVDDAVSPPREVIFVIDNSGSMAGTSIRQAKESLVLALEQLEPTDRFNVIRFDDTMEQVFPAPVPADAENVGYASRFVSALTADGGTMMLPALKAALHDPNAGDAIFLRQVIFLTDGSIGNEAQLFEEIGRSLGRSRLFTVGIGAAPNSHFMNRAATLGRGTFTYIGDLTQVTARMTELFKKLEAPVLTDLKASFPDGAQVEAWPNPLPDLYAGEPILISAKMPKAKGKLVVEGTFRGQRWAVGLNLKQASHGSGLAKIWARKKIASLEQSRFEGRPHMEIEAGVLKTALDYGLVSRLTSLVAVDVTPSRPDNEPLHSADIPVNLPDGWDFDKVFGEPMAPQMSPVKRLRASAGVVQDMYAEAPSPRVQKPASTGVHLPQGSTPADLFKWIGLLLLTFSLVLMIAARRRGRA